MLYFLIDLNLCFLLMDAISLRLVCALCISWGVEEYAFFFLMHAIPFKLGVHFLRCWIFFYFYECDFLKTGLCLIMETLKFMLSCKLVAFSNLEKPYVSE